jgi:hypothetical protein
VFPLYLYLLPLPNGGSNTILFATFLSPFAPGTHTVNLQITGNGALLTPYYPNGYSQTYAYTVTSTTVPEPGAMLGTVVFGAAVEAV